MDCVYHAPLVQWNFMFYKNNKVNLNSNKQNEYIVAWRLGAVV
jgi:hypothetical protein